MALARYERRTAAAVPLGRCTYPTLCAGISPGGPVMCPLSLEKEERNESRRTTEGKKKVLTNGPVRGAYLPSAGTMDPGLVRSEFLAWSRAMLRMERHLHKRPRNV